MNKPGSKRLRRVVPRTQIVSGKVPPERPQFLNLFAELKSLGERSGSALSVVYARVAGSVLERIEQLEDVNAERKFLERRRHVELASSAAQPRPHAEAPRASTTALSTASKTSTLPAKRA